MGSWFDVLLMVLLGGGIAFGFYQGLLKQAFLLVAMYVGTVLAAQYYGYVSGLLLRIFLTAGNQLTDMIGFVALLVAFTMVVTWLIWTGYSETSLPKVFVIDNLGGATLGAVLGLFAIALTMMIANYALQAPWPVDSTVRHALYTGMNSSILQSALSLPVPMFQGALKPLLPGSVPFAL